MNTKDNKEFFLHSSAAKYVYFQKKIRLSLVDINRFYQRIVLIKGTYILHNINKKKVFNPINVLINGRG